MDKILLIVLMFLIAGMGIGISQKPPLYPMFYTMLGGAILVIIYSARKNRKERQREGRESRERRKKFKK
jgi:4-hydroxybenzoate polyprenyltransferase